MPNYGNPVTQGPALLITNATLMPLACLVVAARIYARAFLMKKAWIDDWLMAVAMVRLSSFPILALTTEFPRQQIKLTDMGCRYLSSERPSPSSS